MVDAMVGATVIYLCSNVRINCGLLLECTRKNLPSPTTFAPRPIDMSLLETVEHRGTEKMPSISKFNVLFVRSCVPHQHRQTSTNHPIETPRAEMRRLRTWLGLSSLPETKMSKQHDSICRDTYIPLGPDVRLARHHRQETSVPASELPLVRCNIELVKNGLRRL